MRFDEDYLRMEFFSATDEFISEEVLGNLKYGPLTCKPRFLLFFEGEVKDEIDGADYTKLETSIAKNIPQFDDWDVKFCWIMLLVKQFKFSYGQANIYNYAYEIQ